MTDESIDRTLERLFAKLCLHLSFNPPNAEAYEELHRFLLAWIKKYKGGPT